MRVVQGDSFQSLSMQQDEDAQSMPRREGDDSQSQQNDSSILDALAGAGAANVADSALDLAPTDLSSLLARTNAPAEASDPAAMSALPHASSASHGTAAARSPLGTLGTCSPLEAHSLPFHGGGEDASPHVHPAAMPPALHGVADHVSSTPGGDASGRVSGCSVRALAQRHVELTRQANTASVGTRESESGADLALPSPNRSPPRRRQLREWLPSANADRAAVEATTNPVAERLQREPNTLPQTAVKPLSTNASLALPPSAEEPFAPRSCETASSINPASRDCELGSRDREIATSTCSTLLSGSGGGDGGGGGGSEQGGEQCGDARVGGCGTRRVGSQFEIAMQMASQAESAALRTAAQPTLATRRAMRPLASSGSLAAAPSAAMATTTSAENPTAVDATTTVATIPAAHRSAAPADSQSEAVGCGMAASTLAESLAATTAPSAALPTAHNATPESSPHLASFGASSSVSATQPASPITLPAASPIASPPMRGASTPLPPSLSSLPASPAARVAAHASPPATAPAKDSFQVRAFQYRTCTHPTECCLAVPCLALPSSTTPSPAVHILTS